MTSKPIPCSAQGVLWYVLEELSLPHPSLQLHRASLRQLGWDGGSSSPRLCPSGLCCHSTHCKPHLAHGPQWVTTEWLKAQPGSQRCWCLGSEQRLSSPGASVCHWWHEEGHLSTHLTVCWEVTAMIAFEKHRVMHKYQVITLWKKVWCSWGEKNVLSVSYK